MATKLYTTETLIKFAKTFIPAYCSRFGYEESLDFYSEYLRLIQRAPEEKQRNIGWIERAAGYTVERVLERKEAEAQQKLDLEFAGI